MSLLLSSYNLGELELKNRVVMPPMCMYSVEDNSGKLNDFHLAHYTARAISGVGLIIVEATGVTSNGRISNKDLGLYKDEHILSHKALTDKVHYFGSKIAVQLGHAGRKSEVVDEDIVAPSAIKYDETYKMPKELSLKDIEEIKQNFVDAGLRAKKAGYDAVEIHAAHGYLLNEFLSPTTNKRSDKYGGSLDNRCSLVVEIAQRFKDEVKLPLIVRISATEWIDSGWTLDDSIYLAKKLKGIIDILHVSAGANNEDQVLPPIVPMYQVAYAKKIKDEAQIPTICVGIINSPEEAEALLIGECSDLIAIGRELLRNPNFVDRAAKVFREKDKITAQYTRAY